MEASTRGFDVNRAPSMSVACAAVEDDEEQDDAAGAGAAAAASSSPNNSSGSIPTDFSAQGQGGPGGCGGADRAGSRASDEDDGGSARKKLRLSKEQSAFLEESFKEHATLNPVSKHIRPPSHPVRRKPNSDRCQKKKTFLMVVDLDVCGAQKQKLALAKQLHLRPRQVEVWFQNRRARCAHARTNTRRA